MLFLSLLLFVWPSLRVSKRLAGNLAERFWLFVGISILQLGALASLTSLIGQLRPVAWILGQVVICIFVPFLTGGVRALTARDLGPRWREGQQKWRAFRNALSPFDLAVLLCLCGFVFLSGIVQLATPIYSGDEKMYHASRVLYWIQHQSVFPYTTHNDRQTVTPFGSELFFLWPILLSKTESLGRLIFWFAYPLAAIGQYCLLRSLRLSRGRGLLGSLILLSTPLVAESAIGIKPEMWTVLVFLGTAYWAVALVLNSERAEAKCFFLGVFAMLSVNMRPTAVALLPGIVLITFLVRSASRRSLRLGSRWRALTLGLLCGVLFSGLIIPLTFNSILFGDPFGPAALRNVARAEISPRQLYTHAVRLTFLLLELPEVPLPSPTIDRVNAAATQAISTLGADVPLALEGDQPWPGRFQYHVPEKATKFSIWGLFWIPVLGFALWRLIREAFASWPHIALTAIPTLTLLALPLFLAIAFGTRWMAHSAAPERFLIGAFALSLPIGLLLAQSYFSGRKRREVVMLLAVVFGVYAPLRASIFHTVQSVLSPVGAAAVDQPFQEALLSIPEGSRILFVGEQDAPDYPLFSPRTHFANSVVSWGKSPFSPDRIAALIASEQITEILIQDDRHLRLAWDPDVSTLEMVAWLSQAPGFREVSLSTPHMRLFEAASLSRPNEKAFETTATPADKAFIFVGSRLHGQVGIDPMFLKTPWAVETLGETEGGFLWIGAGPAEGVEFAVWSRESRTVQLRFDVSAGPSRTEPDRNVTLTQDGSAVAGSRTFHGDTSLVIPVKLHPGRNLMRFHCLDAPSVEVMPNGDRRHLIVWLHKIIIEPVP